MHTRLEKLKKLLGIDINDTSKDFLFDFILNTINDMIKNYCNIKELPSSLENILLNMSIAFYRNNDIANEENKNMLVSAIKEGDITVNFIPSDKMANGGFLDNYKAQLNRYRKVSW